ncbi:hypothetical protein LCGC14_1461970, partial [marine sediment metagenome]
MPNTNTFARADGAGTSSGQGASTGADFQFADSGGTRLRLRLKAGSVDKSRSFRVKAGGRVTTSAAAG